MDGFMNWADECTDFVLIRQIELPLYFAEKMNNLCIGFNGLIQGRTFFDEFIRITNIENNHKEFIIKLKINIHYFKFVPNFQSH